MNLDKKLLKGSKSRDEFKSLHKQLLPTFYSTDIDFCFVEKEPIPHIVAMVDYKRENDEVTFSEVLAYNHFVLVGIPVYIVTGDTETGAFKIDQYVGGHHLRPDVRTEFICETTSWSEFQLWEFELRKASKARFKKTFRCN